jgi:choline dehydrogenase
VIFDYIIVGAGPAGCVLANRLSSERHTSVLLLEAGGHDRHPEVRTPAAFSRTFKTELDWNFQTDPEPALNERRLYWPRGKLIGGCSSINAMIHVRGHPAVYDHWAALGNRGWAFDEVLPYFRRAESNSRGASELRGGSGPLRVADPRDPNPLSHRFVEAAAEVGITPRADFNDRAQEGVGFFQLNVHRGRRWSAADAYLKPVFGRTNLEVLTHAHVTRILIDHGRATGVSFLHEGVPTEARAEREVILCAGAVASPHLLMLSGVGPANELHDMGIAVVRDLPGVGANLQDHPVVGLEYRSLRPVSLRRARRPWNLLRYFAFRRGPLASNVAEAGAFVRVRSDSPWPDLQFHFGPGLYRDHGFAQTEGHGFTIGPTLVRPASRGRIRLRSSDPLEPPSIQPNYLAATEDLEVLLEGVRLARRISSASAFDGWRDEEILPGRTVSSRDGLEAFVRERAQTLYHPTSTCTMGTGDGAVVDPNLRVRDVEGLRVADASIMPSIVNGNTHAATVMIAEKAADLIFGHPAPVPS